MTICVVCEEPLEKQEAELYQSLLYAWDHSYPEDQDEEYHEYDHEVAD